MANVTVSCCSCLCCYITVKRIGLLWLLFSWILFSQSEALDQPLPSQFEPRCPESCTCGSTVVCRGTDGIITLNLRDIDLTEVPTFEGVYGSLTTLDLSHNSIAILIPGTFTSNHFPSLEKLCLNDNEIAIIEDDTFQLPSLVELNLSGNSLGAVNFILSLKLSSIHLSRNPLICEMVMLSLICNDEPLVVDGAECTTQKNSGDDVTTSNVAVILLQDYCSNATNSREDRVNMSVIVGSVFGGLFFLMAVLLTIIIPIISFSILCSQYRKNTKPSIQKEHNEESHTDSPSISNSRYVPSKRYAPPTVPPIPPPTSATNHEEIYAAVCESPLTDVSIDSVDYNNGYIVKLDSVPKSTVAFDAFASKMVVVSATSPGEYDMASPGIISPQQQQIGSQISSPKISPYRIFTPKTSQTSTPDNNNTPLSPLSIPLRKPLPPVMPKKWRQKGREDATEPDVKIEGNNQERAETLQQEETGEKDERIINSPDSHHDSSVSQVEGGATTTITTLIKRDPSSYDTVIILEGTKQKKLRPSMGVNREEAKYLEVLL